LPGQYYIPNLKKGTKKRKPKYKMEYATYEASALHPVNGTGQGKALEEGSMVGGHGVSGSKTGGKMEFQYPIPVQNLPKSLREGRVESSKYLRYGMKDLTIGSWVELGRRLGTKGEKGLRRAFRKYMYLE
jgi:endopolyphosphatase